MSGIALFISLNEQQLLSPINNFRTHEACQMNLYERLAAIGLHVYSVQLVVEQ